MSFGRFRTVEHAVKNDGLLAQELAMDSEELVLDLQNGITKDSATRSTKRRAHFEDGHLLVNVVMRVTTSGLLGIDNIEVRAGQRGILEGQWGSSAVGRR